MSRIDEAVEHAISFRHHVRHAMAVFRATNDKERLIARLVVLDKAESQHERAPKISQAEIEAEYDACEEGSF